MSSQIILCTGSVICSSLNYFKHEITKKQRLHRGRIPNEQDVTKMCWGNAVFFENCIHTNFTCAGLMYMHNDHGMRSN